MNGAEEPLRARIRKNYDYLINELTVSLYINVLFQEEVLSSEEMEQLSLIHGRGEQAKHFVEILMRKPPRSIQKFFDIVRTQTDKQPHVYAKLFSDFPSDQAQISKHKISVPDVRAAGEDRNPICSCFV